MPGRRLVYAVLSAIDLVFIEGYAASQGASLLRVDLTAEATRLGQCNRPVRPFFFEKIPPVLSIAAWPV